MFFSFFFSILLFYLPSLLPIPHDPFFFCLFHHIKHCPFMSLTSFNFSSFSFHLFIPHHHHSGFPILACHALPPMVSFSNHSCTAWPPRYCSKLPPIPPPPTNLVPLSSSRLSRSLGLNVTTHLPNPTAPCSRTNAPKYSCCWYTSGT
ncbi:hypothetical protein B0T20DRAFT_419964 [Sordaria brevicollis]|uniref:Uncharacterized protein n=1 Tax=Sordaria brevicollis TaxID=83679 RepID=A0AAE0U9I9_SORBR|nr:hypothetical protein B0T20DRAFT_419964 [Sordaria brevicollis]